MFNARKKGNQSLIKWTVFNGISCARPFATAACFWASCELHVIRDSLVSGIRLLINPPTSYPMPIPHAAMHALFLYAKCETDMLFCHFFLKTFFLHCRNSSYPIHIYCIYTTRISDARSSPARCGGMTVWSHPARLPPLTAVAVHSSQTVPANYRSFFEFYPARMQLNSL